VFTAQPDNPSTESKRAKKGESGWRQGQTATNVEYVPSQRAQRIRFLQRGLGLGNGQRAARSRITNAVRNGGLSGSREDFEITSRLAEAGRVLGIPLLDHVIVGADGYTSFKDRGWL
jgi:RadC-like JAB domain-containing protein